MADDGVDDAPAFRAAIAAAKAAGGTNTVQSGTGSYHLSPLAGDDEIILFDDIDNLSVKGQGAQNTRLILQDRLVKGLLFDGCDDLLVRDFSLTHDPLPGTQGTITWVNNDGTQFDLDIDNDYPLLSDSFFTAEPRLLFGQIIDVINGSPYYHGTLRTETYGSYSWSHQSNRVYRTTLNSTQGGFSDMVNGDRFVFFNSGP